MSTSKESSKGKYLQIIKLGKLYLYLLILGRLVYLIQRVSLPTDIPMDSPIIDVGKFMLQSVIGNEVVKSVCILVLLLYTMFVAIESFVVLRQWFVSYYTKYKKKNMLEKE
ncbi:hypothetical protein [Pelosinus fermentans]|jgi:hypothetical protein|uniref:Uncharacterized protein n=1 Tax=Pelosinus fermentans JBW45 TaxID=1192197 RepID=I9DCN0_9FIRM|nr:hypothetical protein [Pelosinus fermentans]AJQ27126.1 hypothetical protein JBW_01776 [Pelosinus fermentans JBW45]